jgi:hypothetical protein
VVPNSATIASVSRLLAEPWLKDLLSLIASCILVRSSV